MPRTSCRAFRNIGFHEEEGHQAKVSGVTGAKSGIAYEWSEQTERL